MFSRIDSSHQRNLAGALILLGLFLVACGKRDVASLPEIDNPGNTIQVNRLTYFNDASHVLHGIFGFASLSRSSEAGHANFRPNLSSEPMAQRGRLWIQLINLIDSQFHSEGRFISEINTAGRPVSSIVNLREYPHGTYSYHMHHRGGRWEDHGLDFQIFFTALDYMVEPGFYLLGNHFRKGRFYHDTGKTNFDRFSMAYGMAGLQGHAYGWVRWQIPEGSDDMGLISEERLTARMKISYQELLTAFARPTAEVLLKTWDAKSGIYNFDGIKRWDLVSLSALLRGLKTVYEVLYVFGTSADKQAAEELAGHAATIIKNTMKLSREWGLPAILEFSPKGPKAVSDQMNTEHLWTFVNHLGSGFAVFSEEEGMSQFSKGPLAGVRDMVGEELDKWLLFALRKGLADKLIAGAYSFETGEIIDSRNRLASVGIFTVAAANNYRMGNLFERARDWDSRPSDVVENSELLYLVLLRHSEALEQVANQWIAAALR